ncbi:MAG: MotA/TolQ/ExbB proton channel family protein [Pseudomonadota bacterium]
MKFIIFLVCFIAIVFFSASLQENYQGLVSNILSICFVFGGTLLATLISYPLEKIKSIRDVIKRAYYIEKFDYAETTKLVVNITRVYKRLGFKPLEEAAQTITNPYLKLGIQLIADNAEWEQIKSTTEKEFIFDGLQSDNARRIIHAMAKYAPAFGLAGTIIGLMMIFPQLSNPKNIGGSMSLALLTTLYGVLTANLILLPLENKLKDNADDDEFMYRYIIESLHCIQQREHSVVIEQRLSALMPKYELYKYKADKEETMQLRIAENA